MSKKTSKKLYQETKKKLFQERPLGWDRLRDKKEEVFEYARGYRDFISQVKTERECADFILTRAREAGFSLFEEATPKSERLIFTNRGKALALAVRGEGGPRGLKIIASHIDSPRLDLKPNPLYEEMDLAYLKTHYYGGIKKFQWLARPLAIHGVVIKGDGRRVDFVLGEEGPVFCINDLLPHLARKAQGEKKLSEAIAGEKLNVLFGGLPFPAEEGAAERVKLGVLKILSDRFGLVEEDFVSADIEIVPAGPARDVGLDGAFVGGYGQDDRICAFTSLTALLEARRLPETVLLLFLDREEIGSDGNTGAKSRFLELILSRLLRLWGEGALEADSVLELLFRTRAISADVTAGMDPDWPEVHEKRNDAKMGRGVAISKYTGHGGKYGASEARAEYMGWLRQVLNRAGVTWQAVDFGKVDEGGGGTVAKYLAFQGLDIVDMGPPLLSMHSPFEICHKVDLFETHRAYRAFLEAE